MNLPSIQIEKNFTKVQCGRTMLWFSYSTLVAFQVQGFNLVVRQNLWKQTTGKHLNAIDGGGPVAKSLRVDATEFERRWIDCNK